MGRWDPIFARQNLLGTLRIGRLSLPEPRDLGPVLVAWGASLMVMIFEKDLGSSLLFFTLFVVMLWVATEKGRFLVIGAGLFGIGAYGAYQSFQHVRTRVATWLDPWSRVQGKGYQLVQSSFAFAWGGVTGTGIGLGDPTRGPAVQTDFILAAIGEEPGLEVTMPTEEEIPVLGERTRLRQLVLNLITNAIK